MSDFHISNILHPRVSHQNLFKWWLLEQTCLTERNMAAPGTCGRVCGWQLSIDPGSRLEVEQVTLDRETPRSPGEDIWFRGDTAAEPGHPAAAPRANLIRQTAGTWLGGWGSMNEVIHQPPDGTRCVRGIVWRNLDMGLPQSVSHLPVISE